MEQLDFYFRCRGPERTRECARALALAIGEGGLVISVAGPLGAGKTVFVKGLAAGLGLDPEAVSSPSFVIAHEYRGPGGGCRLAHVDLYRVESASELDEAGLLDLLEPGAVVAVEWGDRFPEALPRDCLRVALRRSAGERGPRPPTAEGGAGGGAAASSELRVVEVRGGGERSQAVLERWRELLRCRGLAEFA